jgi:hypothetical protein
VAPLAVFAAMMVIGPVVAKIISAGVSLVFWWMLGLAALVELIAVPTALYLLISGNYSTRNNILMTIVAAIPVALLLLGLLTLKFGHFHI